MYKIFNRAGFSPLSLFTQSYPALAKIKKLSLAFTIKQRHYSQNIQDSWHFNFFNNNNILIFALNYSLTCKII
ncbi:hypothetical protein DRF60_11015 [Chryseobacterium elymi]|uniref:Uncharacterized protein n=1 Tax=Chryseobacterium elymi TaxID=395936 RepID=A0A3D9DHL9_9FLAO|nr:hypothetical protein DRF60_11015 [Chryseobacterium elymi]